MANTKRIFNDKPSIGDKGIYTYINESQNSYIESDSLPLRRDKFEKKDLYSNSIGDPTNEQIIESYSTQNTYSRLRYDVESFVTIDNINVEFNSLNDGNLTDVKYQGFMFSRRAAGMNNTSGFFNGSSANGNYGDVLKSISPSNSFNTLYSRLFLSNTSNIELAGKKNRTANDVATFFNQESEELIGPKNNGTPPGVVMENIQILKNLNNGLLRRNAQDFNDDENSVNNYGPEPEVQVFGNKSNEDNFRPKQIFYVADGQNEESSITKIFDEIDNVNTIYFIFLLSANSSNGTLRKRRFQIYEINPFELFTLRDDGTIGGGKETIFKFDKGTIIDEGGTDLDGNTRNGIPMLTITDFNLTINTLDLSSAGYEFNPIYSDVAPEILKPQSLIPLSMTNLNQNIFTINPSREIQFEPTSTDEETPNEFSDFLVLPQAFVKNTNNDVQVYYKDKVDRQLVSAPTTIELDFQITNTTQIFLDENGEIDTIGDLSDGTQLYDRKVDPIGNNDNSNLMYCVLNWNDFENEIKTVKDAINFLPDNQSDLLNEQKNNNLIFTTKGRPLFNDYATPGIKIIKSLLFNFSTNTDGLIEPLRFKLVTTRIFLDIPVNEFPDFADVGGADFSTIPWPYTTAVIGGVNKNSKYIKSVNKTLSGGKIGDTDIIDEVFLVDAQENDELGFGIERMDLEQVRYFNQSFDMNSFLQIPNSPFYDGENTFQNFYPNPYTNFGSGSYWDGSTIERTFSMESSVGQIFINDNQDINLKQSCKLEINTGLIEGSSIYDSSGNLNKGLLIGDYKIKKTQRNEPMRRDSFIKFPKKTSNKNGAL
tara:strand:- start:188 stop:2650 length:2463 start_codon:yes stop_codon:yes gene_type:complete